MSLEFLATSKANIGEHRKHLEIVLPTHGTAGVCWVGLWKSSSEEKSVILVRYRGWLRGVGDDEIGRW